MKTIINTISAMICALMLLSSCNDDENTKSESQESIEAELYAKLQTMDKAFTAFDDVLSEESHERCVTISKEVYTYWEQHKALFSDGSLFYEDTPYNNLNGSIGACYSLLRYSNTDGEIIPIVPHFEWKQMRHQLQFSAQEAYNSFKIIISKEQSK